MPLGLCSLIPRHDKSHILAIGRDGIVSSSGGLSPCEPGQCIQRKFIRKRARAAACPAWANLPLPTPSPGAERFFLKLNLLLLVLAPTV